MNDSAGMPPLPDATPVAKEKSRFSHMVWPTIGLLVAAFCLYALVRELRSISFGDIATSLSHVPALHWAGAVGGALLAYAALAAYDRIALVHLGKKISWPFIAVASFVAYALSHNIGAAIISGAVVRYRIYSTKGLSAAEVGVLVALCAFTFVLGVAILGGLLLVAQPHMATRYVDIPDWLAWLAGALILAGVIAYGLGSLLQLKPLVIRGFSIFYPKPEIVLRQFLVGPMELLGAAAIIYFCLPVEGNPGYIVVLGVFLASFSLAIFSHAPGGLGVLELLLVAGLRDVPAADVLAALIVFRIFYLVIPLAVSFVVVLIFERQQMVARRKAERDDAA